jgi:hypothetical protein
MGIAIEPPQRVSALNSRDALRMYFPELDDNWGQTGCGSRGVSIVKILLYDFTEYRFQTIDSVETQKCSNSGARLFAFPGIEFVLSTNSDKLDLD